NIFFSRCAQRAAGCREPHSFPTRRSSDLACLVFALVAVPLGAQPRRGGRAAGSLLAVVLIAAYYLLLILGAGLAREGKISPAAGDRKSTRLNSSHVSISYAVFCLKKKKLI